MVKIADRASGPDQPRVAFPDAVPYSPLGGSDGLSPGPTVSVHGGIAVKH